jgi:hypothetical protein
MKERIGSYKELLERQKHLKALLEAKKDLIKSDIGVLKIETKPMSDLIGSLSHSERRNRLLAIGFGFVTQTVLKKLVLMKTHWLVRSALSYLDDNSRLNLKTLLKRFKNRVSSILKRNPIEAAGQAAQVEETEQ